MPRARLEGADGKSQEWRSRMIPRYQQQPSGWMSDPGDLLERTNTRRLRGALSPLLRGHRSPRTRCHLVERLREDFEAWTKRDLSELKIQYMFLDRWSPRVRIGKSGCACRCWSR